MNPKLTPREQGFYFPAEWEKHASTWLSYPHNENSWPGKIHTIFPSYHQFIAEVSKGEKVHINVMNQDEEKRLHLVLENLGVEMSQIVFHPFATNDAWTRDHGPAFVVNPTKQEKAIIDWTYNAWGGKYDAFLDNLIPQQIAQYLDLERFTPKIVMEGGAIDVNGKGSMLTTRSCLLNENRNPQYNQVEIETFLCEYYGVEKVIWLGDGIEGDDTDGHVDDICRFVNEDTVVTVVEQDKQDANYQPLQDNLKTLGQSRLQNGKQLNIAELPMPRKIIYEDQRLPASYANFYISNHAVIVPTFQDKNDDRAIYLLEECFPDRKVLGIDSLDIIWGLGSFHCLSQQEPLVP